MKIAVGCDHAGIELKPTVIGHLKERGIDVVDMGTHSSDSVDYPNIASALADVVVRREVALGILICGTGLGMAISANKVKGVRAVTVSEPFSAKMSRSHNNANILTLGSRVVGSELALMIIDAFLDTPFQGGRHERRVNLMMDLENRA